MSIYRKLLKSVFTIGFLASWLVAHADTLPLKEASIEFSLPDHWHYAGHDQSVPDKIVHIFKRDYVIDKNGKKIIPAILIINENTIADDSVVYFVNKQIQFGLKNIVEFYTAKDGATQVKQAVMLHSSNYNNQANVSFDSIVMAGTYGNYGLTVFCNVTSGAYEVVKDDFFSFLKSVKIKSDLPQDEIIEMTREEDGKKITEMISNKDTSGVADKKMSLIKKVISNAP